MSTVRVTLINDTCAAVRYSISDAEKHKAEALLLDAISLIPTFGDMANVLTIRSLLTNAVSLLSENLAPELQPISDFLSPYKEKSGVLNPTESVERTAGKKDFHSRNSIRVEYVSYKPADNLVIITIFQSEDIAEDPTVVRVSSILRSDKDGERPTPVVNPTKPWKPSPTVISIPLTSDKCLPPFRLVKIPNFTLDLKTGLDSLESLHCQAKQEGKNTTIPDGIFFSVNETPKTPEPEKKYAVHSTTFTTSAVAQNKILGCGSKKHSMLYFYGPQTCMDHCRGVLLNGCIPVVILPNCRAYENNALAVSGPDMSTEAALFRWLGNQMQDTETSKGKRYWAVCWHPTNKRVVCLVQDTANITDYRIQKMDCYYTYMVGSYCLTLR